MDHDYMRITVIMEQYQHEHLNHNGYVLVQIRKDMYMVFPQAEAWQR
jgi:hypothetical protein